MSGSARLRDTDLLALTDKDMEATRGNRMSMIFQEPMTSLNPVFTCGDQIVEALMLHRDMGTREAHERAIEMIARVGIPEAKRRALAVSARAVGGHAPARHDRHGALHGTGAAHR